ncbi:NUDIX hydrolase [Spirochaetia bacterium]|nr:NUDIX hydrolase [Spirochaetia bacterium]
MDISVFLNDTKLNLRSAVMIKTEKGYIFEKDPLEDYYFIVGRRIKINETSEEAAKREIFEELGLTIENIKLKAIVEHFFVYDNTKYHEICFYYIYEINGEINIPEEYSIFNIDEIKVKSLHPKIIYDMIKSEDNGIMHLIINE